MRIHLFAISFALCLLAGCGDGAVPVSGKVTLDGKALPNATVVFEPEGKGLGAHGKTDANGEYTLSLMTKDVKGAIPGKHMVRITATEGDIPVSGANPVPQKQLVPKKYNAKSDLTFDVPSAGTKDANFDLKSN